MNLLLKLISAIKDILDNQTPQDFTRSNEELVDQQLKGDPPLYRLEPHTTVRESPRDLSSVQQVLTMSMSMSWWVVLHIFFSKWWVVQLDHICRRILWPRWIHEQMDKVQNQGVQQSETQVRRSGLPTRSKHFLWQPWNWNLPCRYTECSSLYTGHCHFSLVAGGWSEWTLQEDSECKQNYAGDWKKFKNRECNNPEPKYGGSCPIDESGVGNQKQITCPPGNCLRYHDLKDIVKTYIFVKFLVDGQNGQKILTQLVPWSVQTIGAKSNGGLVTIQNRNSMDRLALCPKLLSLNAIQVAKILQNWINYKM